MNKNSSEEDIAELFGLRATPYLLENCFIEIPTGRKNRNYALITAPEHARREPTKPNGAAPRDTPPEAQEARQSDTRLNEKGNITKPSFERYMKSAADSIYFPNRFESLNFETTENDENDTSVAGSHTINHSRYKQSKRPEVVANRFPENQHTLQKKIYCSE